VSDFCSGTDKGTSMSCGIPNIGAKEFDPLQSHNKATPDLKSDKGLPSGECKMLCVIEQ
jgi:hypothetical protein